MKTPYLYFVALVARLVGGEMPKHFDTNIRRKVRIVLSVSVGTLTATFAVGDWTTHQLLHLDHISFLMSLGAAPLTTQVLYIFLILSVLCVWRVAILRRKSLERHVASTKLTEGSAADTPDETLNSPFLYDYLKVFFVLAILTHIPYVLRLIDPENVFLLKMELVLTPLQLYYYIIIVEFLILFGGRYARKHVTNDRSSANHKTSTSS